MLSSIKKNHEIKTYYVKCNYLSSDKDGSLRLTRFHCAYTVSYSDLPPPIFNNNLIFIIKY